MQNKISFSVIIPLYNKDAYVSETIESVLNQTYGDFEVIVVDDSSTDNSVAIVSQFEDNRLRLFTKPNEGVSAARNFGLTKAQHEYICFLDADDVWDAGYLANLSSVISQFPSAGFICGAYNVFKDRKDNILRTVSFGDKSEEYSGTIDFFKESVKRKRVVAQTSSVCVRKSVLLAMDSWFAKGVSNGEDADMWVRLALSTEVAYYNKPFLFYRTGSVNSLSLYNCDSVKASFPYEKWYLVECNNKYKDKLATRLLYTTAKYCYNSRKFNDTKKALKQCRGFHLFARRLFLTMLMMVKKPQYTIYISTFGSKVLRLNHGKAIEVGATKRTNFQYALRDDTGDNISLQNEYYGELSGLYWIWKNTDIADDDIIGFCHYNKALRISRRKATKWLERNDGGMITKSPIKVRDHPVEDEVQSMLQLLRENGHGEYDAWMKLYDETAASRYDSCRGGNMFIATGATFKHYCKWLFDLLKRMRDNVGDKPNADINMRRYCAYMGERLLSVYVEANRLPVLGVGLRYKKWWLPIVRKVVNTFNINRNNAVYDFLRNRFGYNSSYKRG